MQLSPTVESLIHAFEKEPAPKKGDHRFSVSRTVSVFAVIYEKARNAVEFRAEHLVRRAAIERILKRRLALESDPGAISENLILELLWAKYIDSSFIDTDTTRTVAQIITKYLYLKREAFEATSPKYEDLTWDTIAGIASVEIDEAIVPAEKRAALVNFVYQSIRPKILLPHIQPQALNMLTYIAVERSFAQSDNALTIYHLLTMIHPEWMKIPPQEAGQHALKFITVIQTIQKYLTAPTVLSISKYLRRQLPPFLLLRDFFFEYGKTSKTLIAEESKFMETLTDLAQRKYKEIGDKVRRAVVRSIIYIFLTKMIFALALEAPFDLLIVKKIDYLPLAINAIFPPLLLFLIASFIAVPRADNTRRILEMIERIIYHFDDYQKASDSFKPHQARTKPFLSALFSILYTVGFAISFGFIIYLLTQLHFNIASQIIFVFFIALVSLFAYRIRQSAREYEVVERGGILEPLIDFFFLPILYAGDVLSKEIAKINIFIFIFDFILEAPLKVIFEVVEEWIRFIRTKKEEIV